MGPEWRPTFGGSRALLLSTKLLFLPSFEALSLLLLLLQAPTFLPFFAEELLFCPEVVQLLLPSLQVFLLLNEFFLLPFEPVDFTLSKLQFLLLLLHLFVPFSLFFCVALVLVISWWSGLIFRP